MRVKLTLPRPKVPAQPLLGYEMKNAHKPKLRPKKPHANPRKPK